MSDSKPDSFIVFDATKAERLAHAKAEIGQLIEDGELDSYRKGQLAVALRIVEKYENVFREEDGDRDE